jgi:N-methylhydantoinase A
MEAQTRSALGQELGEASISFERQAEMRFHGQRHTLRVTLTGTPSEAAIREIFETTYEKRYGFVQKGGPLEFVALVLTAFARMDRPVPGKLAPAVSGTAVPSGHRDVYFAEASARVATPVFQRRTLPIGFAAAGPAVIEEYGSSTVVGPRDRFEIGPLGEIRVRFG